MLRFIAALVNMKPGGHKPRATRKQTRPKLAIELLDSRILLSSAPLHVAGNVLQDPAGNTVILRGVDIASLEWTYTGDHLTTSFDVALNTWHANYIRLPLNQDFWFGYVYSSTQNPEQGASYRQRVDDAVAYASARNAYVWLDLHWSDKGQWGANNGQHQMPDDHSTTFWQDVATRYANNPAVLFGLYNEPHVENMSYANAWSLWRNGGSITEGGTTYHTPGMQGLLDTVRGAGATNVVLAGGNGWAGDLSGITGGYALSDSAANLGYDIHLYPGGSRDDAMRDNRVSAAAAGHVVVVGEWGTDPQGNPDLGFPYPNAYVWVRGMLAWLDRHHYSWTAWDLHPAAGPILIADWNYTPTVPFGQEVFAYLTANFDHPAVPGNPDFPALFSTTTGLSLNGFGSAAPLAAIPDADVASLRLTDGNNNEARSAWWNQKVNVQSFTTSYQLWVSPNSNAADGCTFTVQNDPQGTAARGGTGSGLGYVGIQNSVAVFFNLYPGVSQVGQYVNGTPTDIFDLGGSGIDLHAGGIYDVYVTYDGAQLWVTVTDDSNPANTFRTAFTSVDLAGVVQDSTAYVGFTGGTSGAVSTQDIRQWSFAPAPNYPGGFTSADGLTTQGFGGASPLQGTALRLTDGNPNEARSAWWNVKQGVGSFTTSYQLLVDPNYNAAHGYTFTVQNDVRGTAALGGSGDSLGYVGIQNSVAVSFNLYPGVSQIGQYVNGTPTDIVDLGGSGIDLHSGAIYDVTLNYDGSNINVTVTDDANPTTTFSTTFSAVNVPAVVRGTTAYVGFTGGTGAATSVQDILSWSYVDPPAPYRPPEPGAGGVPIPALVRKIRPWLEGTDWSYVDPPGPYRPPEPRAGGVPISAVVRQIRPWLEETERHSDIAISGPSRFTVAQRERVWRATPHPEADDDALPAAVPAAAATV
jgi:hypothetical protein